MKDRVILLVALALLTTACVVSGCGNPPSDPAAPPASPPTGGGGGGTSPAAVDISGKWEFANGMNVNLTQVNSQVTGSSVYQTTFNSSVSSLLIEPCSPNSVTGSVSALTVSLQSGVCGISPPGGYSTTTTANATGTLLNGAAWGDAFKVSSVAGQYSGTMTFYSSSGTVGTSTATLTLSEDQNHDVVGILAIAGGGTLSQIAGQAVGGTINLGSGELVGVIQNLGGVEVSVHGSGSTLFCGPSTCATLGNGVLK